MVELTGLDHFVNYFVYLDVVIVYVSCQLDKL